VSLTIQTMQDLVDQVRDDLDEPYAAPPDTTNFWSQAFIVKQINRGLRTVWQTIRNDKGSEWCVRRLRSDDPVLTIYGQPYNPKAFRAVTNQTELILPPDLGELLFIEPVLNTVTTQAADVRFRFEAGLNGPNYREVSRIATVGLAEYYGAVVQRLDGPRLVFAPAFVDSSVDFTIEYVVKPDDYALTDTFEGLGFDDLFLDAVEAYAVRECYKKAVNPQKVEEANATWMERKALVIEAVSPMQTVEHEKVSSFLPDDGGW
jgi:hypothetical protein